MISTETRAASLRHQPQPRLRRDTLPLVKRLHGAFLMAAVLLATPSSMVRAQADDLKSEVWRVEWVQVIKHKPGCCLFGAPLLPTPVVKVLSKPPLPMQGSTSSGCVFTNAGPGTHGEDRGGGFFFRLEGFTRKFRLNENDNRIIEGLSMSRFTGSYHSLPELRDVLKANPRAIDKLDEFDRHAAMGRGLNVTCLALATTACVAWGVEIVHMARTPYYEYEPRQPVLISAGVASLLACAFYAAGQYVTESSFSSLIDAVDIFNGGR